MNTPKSGHPNHPYELHTNPPTRALALATSIKHPLPTLVTNLKPPATHTLKPTPNRKRTPLDTPVPPDKPTTRHTRPHTSAKQTRTQPYRKKQHPQDTENPCQPEKQAGDSLCLTMINSVTNPKRECATSLTQNTQPHQRKRASAHSKENNTPLLGALAKHTPETRKPPSNHPTKGSHPAAKTKTRTKPTNYTVANVTHCLNTGTPPSNTTSG